MARRRLIDRRDELGLTQEDLAEAIGISTRMIRNYEDGTKRPTGERRLRLAEALKLSGPELTLALHDGDQSVNGHPVPSWLTHFASLEQAAGGIATFEPVVVPGLLQTAGYACAVEAHGPDPLPDDEVARKVENRIARQAVLGKPGFHLAAVIDESVLHRVAGDRSVMADQLEHLASFAGHPAVDLRVLPLDAGVFSAAFGSFTLFNSPGSVLPFMAVTEDRARLHYLDHGNDIEVHVSLFVHLADAALPPDSSAKLIRFVANKEHR